MGDTLWEDWVSAALGVWLFFSPMFGLGGVDNPMAWNAYICGVAITIVAVAGLASPQRYAEATNLVLGLWVLAFGVVVGESGTAAALYGKGNQIAVGGIVAVVSLIGMRAPLPRRIR